MFHHSCTRPPDVGSAPGYALGQGLAALTGLLFSTLSTLSIAQGSATAARASLPDTASNTDVFGPAACVLGRVVLDCSRDPVHGTLAWGIPGVRLVLQDGTMLSTDSEGRFSLCGLPRRTQVLRVDAPSLPRGARLQSRSSRNTADGNSVFLDLKSGELQRADFIESSCSSGVVEQVKARRSLSDVRTVDAGNGSTPALQFEGKSAGYLQPPGDGTKGTRSTSPPSPQHLGVTPQRKGP